MSDPIVYCDKCLFHAGPLKDTNVLKDANHAGGPQGTCGGVWKVHRPIYAAVFLTEESKKMLLSMIPARYPTVYAEHMTLAFGRHMNPTYPLGEKVKLWADMHYWDDRGQCVTVILQKDMKVHLAKEQVPHVTISCAEGVKPFYSTELIKTSGKGDVWSDLEFEGVIDYHPRTKP